MIARSRSFAVAFFMGVLVLSSPGPGRAQPGNSRVFGDLLKRVPVHANAYYAQNQKYTVASTPSGVYAGYNYWSANSKLYDASVIKKQSDAMMSVDLDQRWQAMETSVADIRRKMVEKYGVDF